MDVAGSYWDVADFGARLEEDLTRDVSILREALEIDNGMSDGFSDYPGEKKGC